ncbi:MAG: OFA family MFS transporter [Lachnospiraceae bacterium]|nr:OFA family MFS transporter [Lachnospiraceae bacterium]
MIKIQNKWVRAAIPALLLHCSIGTVYCWSLISGTIVDYLNDHGTAVSKSTIEWAFSIAIFFLGMSAAFLGPMVEKNIHRSSLVAAVCFAVGLAGTGLSIYLCWVPGIFIFYGAIMGIGLGTGYLSPVKTLMLWFSDQKGLATGLSIAGFGLAKMIASPIMEFLQGSVGIVAMFYILAVFYFILMFIGHLLLAKPEGWVEPQETQGGSVLDIFKNRAFLGIWIMFYINITCGLALISQEKSIYLAIGLGSGVIAVLCSVTALFNAGGRLGFSTLGDHLKDRNTVYKIIFALSIALTALVLVTGGIKNQYTVLVVLLLIVINACYGGGFSNVPALLSDHFGMDAISRIHGLCLSAWAMAGLTGNQIATLIVNNTGEFVDGVNPVGYQNVLYFTLVMYIIAGLVCVFVVPKKSQVKEQ